MNKFEELEKLQYLKENKAITEQEFEIEKNKILNDTSNEETTGENKKDKAKIKPWQIILIIISSVVIRNYNIL